jgi:thiol-disulfide isomerase/thioredoxin
LNTPLTFPQARRPHLSGGAPWHVLAFALALLLVLPGQVCAKDPAEIEIGKTLRDAPLIGLNGPSRKLSDYRGRPLLINVWASWCGPCRQEMASLERLAWQDKALPFAVIGISTDDYAENAMKFLNGSNASISHFIDDKLQLEAMLGANRIPLTVLVDAKGQVVDKVYGAKPWDGPEAKALIDAAFRRRSPAAKP